MQTIAEMRTIILAGAILAVGASSAVAQSPDPAKRDAWALSMSDCMGRNFNVDEKKALEEWAKDYKEYVALYCEKLARRAIKRPVDERLRETMVAEDFEPYGRTVGYLRSRASNGIVNRDIFAAGILDAEIAIRYSIFEDCTRDPAGIERVSCWMLSGLDQMVKLRGGEAHLVENDWDALSEDLSEAEE